MIEVIMETMRDRIRKISRYYSKKNQLRQAAWKRRRGAAAD